MGLSIEQEASSLLLKLGQMVDAKQVQRLMSNPGHANGHNVEQYLKNDAWQRSRHRKATKAVAFLKDFLSF